MTNKLTEEQLVWLDTKSVLELYELFALGEKIKDENDEEDYSLLDGKLLDSAINTPLQTMFGIELYPTIYNKIACLTRSLICNHAFKNGNKRFGTLMMFHICRLNKIYLDVTDEETICFAIEVAEGKKKLNDISIWLQQKALLAT